MSDSAAGRLTEPQNGPEGRDPDGELDPDDLDVGDEGDDLDASDLEFDVKE